MNSIRAVTPAGNEAEIYKSRIYEAFDEYLSSVGVDKDEDVNSSLFAGALKNVYVTCFKPQENQMYNRNTIIDTADLNVLDALWNIYAGLCYKYNIRPTVLRFGIMTGISEDTFNSWLRKEYRASSGHSEWYQKIRRECESSVVDSILQSNSIGGIFIAKSRYGYRETSPITPEESTPIVHDSAEQIAARHAATALPEKPVLTLEEV